MACNTFFTQLVLFITIASSNFPLVNKVAADEIIFHADEQTLNNILLNHKGQLIYIDCWASWCSSCYRYFNHSEKLNEFFNKNEIVRVYLAFEKQASTEGEMKERVEQWKDLVYNHNLAGHHYYVELKSELFNSSIVKLMNGKLSLPRFIIIDRNGRIIDRKAIKPDDEEKLISHLSKYLE